MTTHQTNQPSPPSSTVEKVRLIAEAMRNETYTYDQNGRPLANVVMIQSFANQLLEAISSPPSERCPRCEGVGKCSIFRPCSLCGGTGTMAAAVSDEPTREEMNEAESPVWLQFPDGTVASCDADAAERWRLWYDLRDVQMRQARQEVGLMVSAVADIARRIGPARLPESIKAELDALVSKWRHWS